MKVPFVDLAAQHEVIGDDVDRAMLDVVKRSDFILGREVTLFEEEFAAYCGVSFAIGVDTGISALELSLRAMGVGPGDEVITAANSFIASASPISMVGARPILVDVDPQTYNLNPDLLETAITARTKAVIPVHLYGQPADLQPILDIAQCHGIRVLEDACQAHGALYRGRRAGSYGDAAAFSFYPAKNLGAYGDGGMVLTNDPDIAEKVRMLRNYGQREKYRHEVLAFNRRLDTIQAAVMRVKLRYLDAGNDSRYRHATLYSSLLAEVNVITPFESSQVRHVYHLYVVQVEKRAELQRHLTALGISTGIHYPTPIHLQPAYAHLGYRAGDFPVTEELAGKVLSLPMYPELRDEQIHYVAESVRSFVGASQAVLAH